MDNLQVMRELAEQIAAAGLAGNEITGNITGCSPDEVQEVEQGAGVKLPGTYRAFLLTMGRGAGEFLRGSEVYYPDVLGMTEDAQELLDECDPPLKLPDDAFVFFFHQGCQFGFFRTASGTDNPELYRFVEGEPILQPLGETFLDWLRTELEFHASVHRSLQGNPRIRFHRPPQLREDS